MGRLTLAVFCGIGALAIASALEAHWILAAVAGIAMFAFALFFDPNDEDILLDCPDCRAVDTEEGIVIQFKDGLQPAQVPHRDFAGQAHRVPASIARLISVLEWEK